ncbi:MAG: alpha/beta hydrolase [Alphaproteobacteria bacterium]|nr:alpha/beta hydrolase [Alphaproteobacteria bacterium]
MTKTGKFRLRLPFRAALTGMALAAALLFALVEPALAQKAVAQKVVSDIPLVGGGSERVMFTGPGNPIAILVMFAGGEGTVQIADSGKIGRYVANFLIRTLPLWVAQGFAVEILGAPNNASLKGQRHTEAYADAVGRAVDFARTKSSAPVWLVGTSAGTPGAANGAAHLGSKVAGLVLTSSVTEPSPGGETVFDTNLAAIRVPVLIVANQNDACRVTPPGDAPRIAAALVHSPRKDVVYVQSDLIVSSPCEAFAPHAFLGIETAVVKRVADWIRATPAR